MFAVQGNYDARPEGCRAMILRSLIGFAAVLSLVSCGGGGGDGNPGGGASNQPPVVSSVQSASVQSGASGNIYQAAASDPEGQPVTFSISGGTDAARFSITPTGALSFLSPPDFDHPTDSDANNTYVVRISASDGANASSIDVTVTVVDATADFQVRQITRVGENARQVIAIPGDQRFLIVAERDVWIVDPKTGANSILMPSCVLVMGGCDLQIQSIAFSPNFATDRTFYAAGRFGPHYLDVRRFQLPAAGAPVVGSGQPVLRSLVNGFVNRNETTTVEARFGPDGFLYMATGDSSNDFGRTPGPSTNGFAQDLSKLSGKVLRIDVSGDDYPGDALNNYRIPAGNPFKGGGGAPEIFAYGFHIPRALDFNGQDLLLADRGYPADSTEPHPVHEIDMVRPADAGGNYGFYRCQGDRDFAGTAPCGFPTKLPVIYADDPATTRFGYFFVGAVIYNGPVVSLRGQYLVAYSRSASPSDPTFPPSFFTLPVSQLKPEANQPVTTLKNRTASFKPVSGVLGGLTVVGVDAAGNAYLVDVDGDVFIVEPRP
jgi:glucose/arabinose dehydrogenase